MLRGIKEIITYFYAMQCEGGRFCNEGGLKMHTCPPDLTLY